MRRDGPRSLGEAKHRGIKKSRQRSPQSRSADRVIFSSLPRTSRVRAVGIQKRLPGRSSRTGQAQSDASASSLPRSTTSSSTTASTSSTTSSTDQPQVGAGPVPPKFDRSDFQSPTISELRAIGIGTKTSPGKLDLLVYCPLMGRCPHCKSALITANSVG